VHILLDSRLTLEDCLVRLQITGVWRSESWRSESWIQVFGEVSLGQSTDFDVFFSPSF
jgi:hypothetical protein